MTRTKKAEGVVIFEAPIVVRQGWEIEYEDQQEARPGWRPAGAIKDRAGPAKDGGLEAIATELRLRNLKPRNSMIREFRRIIEEGIRVTQLQPEGCGSLELRIKLLHGPSGSCPWERV